MSSVKTKRRALWIVGVVMCVSTIFAIAGCKSAHAEIDIAASPEAIWDVLADPTSYQEWNPVIVPKAAEYSEGSEVVNLVTDEKGNQIEMKSRVKAITHARELRQGGGTIGILTFDHRWVLEPIDGGTRVTQYEDYRGIGVWFWDPSYYRQAYANANEALKRYVESQHAANAAEVE